MGDAGYLTLGGKRRGDPLVTLFAPHVTPGGLSAPSLCAHRAIRAGTHVQHQNVIYRLPRLVAGMHRPAEGFFFPEVP